ncbi:MurR/RpiR family transcriptional regulator [Ligilactobacillus pobuzihii]|nr:MurR/RpiR family transcriptional regulator [Ligilactobacillus pobuzihii]GEN49085.1 hypothetical protein LPO01_18770 [Ligilactobacillus pobuzihii]
MSTRKMLSYLNHHCEEDVQTKLVRYMFKNYRTIQNMTITKMSQECFVSAASISRAARNFGYRSFDVMKKQVAKEMTMRDPRFLFRIDKHELTQLKNQPDKYYKHLAEEISLALLNTVSSVPMKKIDQLLQEILSAKQVTFFGFNTMIDSLKVFQSALLHCGIITALGENKQDQLHLASTLRENSVAIVFSSFGNFFSNCDKVFDQIMNSQAHTILVTQSSSTPYSISFDETLTISTNTSAEVGSYPMNFLLDVMARRAFVLARR